MRAYDMLPPELRRWTAEAALPWRAKSVKCAYEKALARTGRPDLALAELDRLQRDLILRDAARIWGEQHPDAQSR